MNMKLKTKYGNAFLIATRWMIPLFLTIVLAELLKPLVHIYSSMYLLIFALIYIAFEYLMKKWKSEPGYCIEGFVFGYFFTLAFLLGAVMEKSMLTGINLILALFSAIVGGIFVAIIYSKVIGILQKICAFHKNIEFNKGDGAAYLFYIAIMFICWLPVLLAYYPGIFGYDVKPQVRQGLTGVYTTHHPLTHTIILSRFYKLGVLWGNLEVGLVCYTLIQMCVLAAALGYMLLFFKRIGTSKKWRIIVLVFMALLPNFSVLSISMTKDVVFTALFVVVATVLAYWSIDESLLNKKRFVVLFLMSALGMCLFRNNGIYIICVCIFCLLFRLRHKSARKMLVYHIMIAVSFFAINFLLVSITNAEKGSPNEMLSVPYQQIANVYYYEKDNLSENVIEDIKMILPSVDGYRMEISDAVKKEGTARLHMKEFVKLYLDLMIQYPIRYIEGFLRVTQGYWYVDDVTGSKVYGEGLDYRQGYLPTETKDGFDVKHTSYFPALENLYENLISANEYQQYPIFACIFSLALYFWMIMLSMIHILFHKEWNAIMPFALIVGLLLTIFLGPCVLARYAFPYMAVTPLLFIISFGYGRKEK